MHATSQAIAKRIGGIDGLRKLTGFITHHMQDGAKHFAVQPTDVWDFPCLRANEITLAQMFLFRRDGDELCFMRQAAFMRIEIIKCILIDHRADIGFYQAWFAYAQFTNGTAQHFKHAISDTILHAQQARGRAALAGRTESACYHIINHLFRQGR